MGLLVGLLGLTAVLVLAWATLLGRKLRGIRARRQHSFRPARAWKEIVGTVVPANAFGAVVGKELRAWARHPRRSLELRVAIWSALLLTVIPGLFGGREELWPWAGAVLVVVATVGFANVYGMDGSSLWITLVTSSARPDVRGRQVAWLAAVGAPAMLVTVALTAAAGAVGAWPWVLAIVPRWLARARGSVRSWHLLLPAALPERRGGDPLDLGDEPTTGGRLMLQGLTATLVVPLLAVPAGLAVWLLPPPTRWLGVVVGLCSGALYAWILGDLAAARLERSGPELLDQMRLRAASPSRPRSVQSSDSNASTPRSMLVSIGSGILLTVGIILLVPQGIVALLFSLAGSDVRAWFVARYLPDDLQVPVSVVLAVLGASILGGAWLVRRGRVYHKGNARYGINPRLKSTLVCDGPVGSLSAFPASPPRRQP